MTDLFADPALWLPVAFAILLGLSIVLYVVLDGYDLGVGILTMHAKPAETDTMVASIGPFWDANETWLVLAVGILLVAFPVAHGMILTALYLPVTLMLVALILRGVAFEFRAKAPPRWKPLWNFAFWFGSLGSALTQGYMLGLYIMGFAATWQAQAFALLTALCLAAAYAFLGALWLLYKTEGWLQHKAVTWAKGTLAGTVIGMAAVSIATPLVSPRIFDKWFSFPQIIALAPIPLVSALLVLALWMFLKRMPRADHSLDLVPLLAGGLLVVLGFAGLAWSFFPYVVPEKLTIWQAAAAPESLWIIFVGTLIVLPVIVAYSAIAYIVFRGKATDLTYY
jgi:cytochrome d ubiquinol oxidase subunit II